ncbi:MAG: sigma-70 family RNA polymerase sigma factor [Planctomycetes bacterium]|nr:sigma-70 family RNA polymerase sigma factor [Planctomycetota bacterium]
MIGPDDALIERARACDEPAWEELVRRYGRSLHAHALRMSRDAHAAEDLAQEAWVRAFRFLGGYRPGTSFRAWLFTILTNLLRDHARRAARAPALEPEAVAAAAARALPDASARELAAATERAIAELPAEQREVLLLRTVEGLSHDEIAQATGANAATVRWRLFRARERLAQRLEGWTGQPAGEGGAS